MARKFVLQPQYYEWSALKLQQLQSVRDDVFTRPFQAHEERGASCRWCKPSSPSPGLLAEQWSWPGIKLLLESHFAAKYSMDLHKCKRSHAHAPRDATSFCLESNKVLNILFPHNCWQSVTSLSIGHGALTAVRSWAEALFKTITMGQMSTSRNFFLFF